MTNTAQMFEQYEREEKITILPPGVHRLKVASCSAKRDGVGFGYIAPTFRVVSGPHAGRLIRTGRLQLNERFTKTFFIQVEGFGLGHDYFCGGGGNPSLDQIAEDLVGRVVDADLEQDEWPRQSGEMRNRITIGGIKLVSMPERDDEAEAQVSAYHDAIMQMGANVEFAGIAAAAGDAVEARNALKAASNIAGVALGVLDARCAVAKREKDLAAFMKAPLKPLPGTMACPEPGCGHESKSEAAADNHQRIKHPR